MRDFEWMEYKEKASHGTALLPMRRYRCRVPQGYKSLSMHWHEEAEFTCIMTGRIVYDINLSTYRVDAGAADGGCMHPEVCSAPAEWKMPHLPGGKRGPARL